MPQLNDLMIDLETLGTKPASPIIAIGAVFFDRATGHLGEEFYQKIDVTDALKWSRMSGDTFVWWMKQSEAARMEAISGFLLASDAFSDFCNWTSANANLSKLRPWGNGASFDITMMEVSLERIIARDAPWKFWNIRDVRTLKDVAESVGYSHPFKLKGVAHKALDDAKHQARFTSFYWQSLHGKTPEIHERGTGTQERDRDVMDDFDDFDDAPAGKPEDGTGDFDDLTLDDL